MSQVGSGAPSGVRQALASAIQQGGGNVPGPNGTPGKPMPPQGPPPQQGNAGGLAELAQTYAKCEQTKQCSPQDLQVLKAGLPQLQQMAQNIQKIIEIASQQPPGGAPPQAGNAPPPGSSPAPGQ